jgi:hypothetical protein
MGDECGACGATSLPAKGAVAVVVTRQGEHHWRMEMNGLGVKSGKPSQRGRRKQHYTVKKKVALVQGKKKAVQ